MNNKGISGEFIFYFHNIILMLIFELIWLLSLFEEDIEIIIKTYWMKGVS